MCKHIHLVLRTQNVPRKPHEFNDDDDDCTLVVDEHTIDELQGPIFHEISKQTSENYHLHLDAKKKILLEEFHKLVTTEVTTSDQLDFITKTLKQAAVTVHAMSAASARDTEVCSYCLVTRIQAP